RTCSEDRGKSRGIRGGSMKKFVPELFVLMASLSVSVGAQQYGALCGGPAPEPAMSTEGGRGPSSLEAWTNAMEHWVPCTNQGITHGGVVSARALGFAPVKAARKDFDQGMRAVKKGLNAEALEHFREAVRLDQG